LFQDVGGVEQRTSEQPSLFGYRTGVSLRLEGRPSRSWVPWLLVAAGVLAALGLVLGLIYWLVTFDAEGLMAGLRRLVTFAFGAH
jgi:hypothetical protein